MPKSYCTAWEFYLDALLSERSEKMKSIKFPPVLFPFHPPPEKHHLTTLPFLFT